MYSKEKKRRELHVDGKGIPKVRSQECLDQVEVHTMSLSSGVLMEMLLPNFLVF
jgi:hypothetical protein